MFGEAWFWLMFFAFFFNTMNAMNLQRGIYIPYAGTINMFVSLGLLAFAVLGLFFADHWWQPLVAIAVCFIGGAILSSMIPDKIKTLVGVFGMIASVVLTATAYIVWF